jgi:hypothetical protein
MRNENGPLQIDLPSPVAAGNHAHSRLGFKQAGLKWILPQIDAGGPKARNNGLPVTALKKWLEGIWGV